MRMFSTVRHLSRYRNSVWLDGRTFCAEQIDGYHILSLCALTTLYKVLEGRDLGAGERIGSTVAVEGNVKGEESEFDGAIALKNNS